MLSAIERREEILSLLNVRRHETIDNLAFNFDVSRMTIRRDIEALSNSHPIYTTQGTGGGVHFMDGCTLGRKYLTEEQEALLIQLSEGLNDEDLHTIQSILKTFSVSKKIRR